MIFLILDILFVIRATLEEAKRRMVNILALLFNPAIFLIEVDISTRYAIPSIIKFANIERLRQFSITVETNFIR